MANLLGSVRLSNLTDETTSPERQREQISLTAQIRGDRVINITEDLDVSGAVSPFERDQLGEWLTDPTLIAKWDIICVAKLDRLSRSLADFVTFYEWCKTNNKNIVSVSEGIDFSTSMGKMFANILIMFAEFERERMAERRKETKQHLDAAAKWNGGTIRYGYQAVKAQDGGYILVPEPTAVKVINGMADDILAGKSATAIAKDLTVRNIPTAQGGQWRTSTVTRILRSPHLKGYVIANDKVVRGTDGLPLRRESIITDEKWDRVQAALDQNTKVIPTSGNGTPLLLQVAFCQCGKPIYLMRKAARKTANYYCSTKTTTAPCDNKLWMRSDVLEGYVTDKLIDVAGNVPMRVKESSPVVDNTTAIAEVDEAISNLMDLAERGMFKGSRASQFSERMAVLESRKQLLEVTQSTTTEPQWITTGQTFGEYYSELSIQAKRQFMLNAGIKVYVETLDAVDIDLINEGILMPMPSPDGKRVVGILGNKHKVTIDLGDVATLKQLASEA